MPLTVCVRETRRYRFSFHISAAECKWLHLIMFHTVNALCIYAILETAEVCVGTSVGTITEPDCLGPCEPGTSVTLEGIVWHETEGGELLLAHEPNAP
ncbi:unnamed protein product [Euphydryas editha]|uniref:Uncharacterized protein n=1 Tax=Euphydryas editha TaxID=104508 RepID=A0AAU9TW38_EUPED|nr:unnamed protein product [Euphydryas editha]